MFVHNHRTVAIWMKMPVGKKEWGWGTAGRNPDERDRGIETIAIFLMVPSLAILDTL